MKELILGSQSPRRKEILGWFSLPFRIAHPIFNEEAHPYKGCPDAYVKELAEGKLASLIPMWKEHTILTADTIVELDGRLFAKATSKAEAKEFLLALSGKLHTVQTAISLYHEGIIATASEKAEVIFNPFTPDEIDLYLDKIHWHDKAGAYAIQEGAGIIVKEIRGSYSNVMGLPVNTLAELLKRAGIHLLEKVLS